MKTRKRKLNRMYAVSLKGRGIIGGTLAYNRRAAICFFQGGTFMGNLWVEQKRFGYRTVKVAVRVVP